MSSNNYYLGIDVSKGYADFVILDNEKAVVLKPVKFYDTFEGHGKLYAFLGDFCKSHKIDKIYSAVESTGGYEDNWYAAIRRFSQDYPICVARINPYGVYYSGKADLKRVTTDKISAFSIAEYMVNYREKLVFDFDDEFTDLKRQVSHIRLLKTQKAQLLNQLESVVYSAFPELLRYCKGGFNQWVLKLLLKYPTASKLSRARIYTVAKIPNITNERAQELINLARKTVASASSLTTELIIQSLVNQILDLKKIIDANIKHLDSVCKYPGYDLIKSFPGIGDWSAIVLLIEIGNVERFPDAKKLASYFGLNPRFRQSGDGMTKSMMSKQGRIEPRKILYMVALCGINSNPILKKVYEKHTSKGMKGAAAIGVCMHKAIRIVYGMLKNNTKFNADVDENNQKRSIRKKEINIEISDFDENAPISQRKYKEIKAEVTHQNVSPSLNTVS
jgi:transposase